ncbi:hypothetical protein D3C71_1411320 [compost metagenome]
MSASEVCLSITLSAALDLPGKAPASCAKALREAQPDRPTAAAVTPARSINSRRERQTASSVISDGRISSGLRINIVVSGSAQASHGSTLRNA